MPFGPDFLSTRFIEVRDTRGNLIKIGHGATRDGRVVLLNPSGHIPVLNMQQATQFVDSFRRTIQDAAQHDG